MELGLAGKTALITGGSKGIGLETARALARERSAMRRSRNRRQRFKYRIDAMQNFLFCMAMWLCSDLYLKMLGFWRARRDSNS
jgi:short-subunit dehydrogenase involved in D-alanine esterification of teichoic acids